VIARLRALLRAALFRFGWDTRNRHAVAARVLRTAIAQTPPGQGPMLLDVGCGRAGMAAFLEDVQVIGVDLEAPDSDLANRQFVQASIAELPFGDRTFAYVSCIDVLQELPSDVRVRGLSEMLRVARTAIVIAAPQGEVADRSDAEFEQALLARGAPVPPWVLASRANPYPTVPAVLDAIRQADPGAEVSVSYGEPVRISRLVRGAAVRSSALYALVNLVFGVVARAIPPPDATRGYRMLIVVRPSGTAVA
jgi:SAM-dependent methyltransferase